MQSPLLERMTPPSESDRRSQPHRYLVIEDSSAMRQWLRSTLLVAGVKQVDMAATYHEALYRIRNSQPFDVVLCDYILSDIRDGQQLLEEVKRTRLIPPHTIWLMITGESQYSQVVAAAELVPDDYLLKPVSPGNLMDRIRKSWVRNQDILHAKKLLDAGKHRDCHTHCLSVLREGNTEFPLDHLRIQGEALLLSAAYQVASNHYQSILHRHNDLPWARLGLARASLYLDHYDEAQEILTALSNDLPEYLHAQDVLVQVHEAKNDLPASLSLLQKLVATNQKSLHRHRELIRVAADLGDGKTLLDTYAKLHRHGIGSSFVTPSDFCAYATLLSGPQGPADAKDRLKSLSDGLGNYHKDNSAYALPSQILKFAQAKTAGNKKEMGAAYQAIHQLTQGKEKTLEVDLRLSLFACAIDMGDTQAAENLALQHYNDFYGNDRMCERIEQYIPDAQKSGFVPLKHQVDQEVETKRKAAVNMVTRGEYAAALAEFIRLADTYDNLTILISACVSILRQLDKERDPALLQRLQSYIRRSKQKDPDNPRLLTIIKTAERLSSEATQ